MGGHGDCNPRASGHGSQVHHAIRGAPDCIIPSRALDHHGQLAAWWRTLSAARKRSGLGQGASSEAPGTPGLDGGQKVEICWGICWCPALLVPQAPRQYGGLDCSPTSEACIVALGLRGFPSRPTRHLRPGQQLQNPRAAHQDEQPGDSSYKTPGAMPCHAEHGNPPPPPVACCGSVRSRRQHTIDRISEASRGAAKASSSTAAREGLRASQE